MLNKEINLYIALNGSTALVGHITAIHENRPKASFSFHKITQKNIRMPTLYTNWTLYITSTVIYYIRQKLFCKAFSSRLNPYMSPYVKCVDKSTYIRYVFSQCHVDSLACTEQNVINQTLTQD